MRWKHEVNPMWLEARRHYLNASSIVDMLPASPTGRKRDVSKYRMQSWARRNAMPEDVDVYSSGAAARGHLLEPYAVDVFNEINETYKLGFKKMHHWDDCLIEDGALAYSPDALSVEQPKLLVDIDMVDPMVSGEDMQLLEVKCYGAERHYVTGLGDPSILDERWQIACAMAVSTNIEKAALILFNPSAEHQAFVHVYMRDDLEEEIGMCYDIAWQYQNEAADYDLSASQNSYSDVYVDRARIFGEIEKKLESSGLNPE